MPRRIFLDLDGVLADFDGHYEALFGWRPDRNAPEPKRFWRDLAKVQDFFADLPLLPDARVIYQTALCLNGGMPPTILTGLPDSMPRAALDKQGWVAEHFGPDVPVICCRSVDKRHHGAPGDVLVDDWLKYRSHWEAMGGIFVHHVTVTETITRLTEVCHAEGLESPRS